MDHRRRWPRSSTPAHRLTPTGPHTQTSCPLGTVPALLELPSRGTILLDSGTTTLAMARALPASAELEMVTNSVAIAAVLAGQERLHRFAEIEEIALLVTDTGLDDETSSAFDAAGMEVIRT